MAFVRTSYVCLETHAVPEVRMMPDDTIGRVTLVGVADWIVAQIEPPPGFERQVVERQKRGGGGQSAAGRFRRVVPGQRIQRFNKLGRTVMVGDVARRRAYELNVRIGSHQHQAWDFYVNGLSVTFFVYLVAFDHDCHSLLAAQFRSDVVKAAVSLRVVGDRESISVGAIIRG